MHPIIAKTFGGLTPAYYIRNLLFAAIFPAFIIFMVSSHGNPISLNMAFFMLVSTLLYPYSRFVYESVVGYLTGGNIFFVNAILMLFVKFITMLLCWTFAIFIAPIGLAWLYFHHTRNERNASRM